MRRVELPRVAGGLHPPARDEHGGELGQARDYGNRTDARDRAARERTRKDALQGGDGRGEEVAVPERGPGGDDEDQPCFEEVRGEQQAREQRDDQPPVCTRARRSTRAATSR